MEPSAYDYQLLTKLYIKSVSVLLIETAIFYSATSSDNKYSTVSALFFFYCNKKQENVTLTMGRTYSEQIR